MCVGGGGGGGGGSDIFIRRLGSFFWVQDFEFQYFIGFSEKNIFLGYEVSVNIFWVITKLDYRGHFYAF